MPASDSWHSGRKTTSTLSFWYQLSTCSFAASVPCSVISLRVSFNSLSSSARRSASSSLCARRSASASFAVFNRPPAFRHGPMTNPIWYAVIAPRSRLFFSASLRSPRFLVCAIFLRPYFTRIRFSSCSFITSPTVAIAANSSKSSHSIRGTPRRAYKTCTSLYATTAPQISGNGYGQSACFGSITASAGGIFSFSPSKGTS